MAKKSMDTEDIIIRKKIVFSVQQSMKTARRRGLVASVDRHKNVVLWALVDSRLSGPRRAKGAAMTIIVANRVILFREPLEELRDELTYLDATL